ncbi:MAG TPA: GAF and ANTAR domain-containing protein [Mycobacteriales bacterium]|nr:GAF and ANTAR domain-containing protein [Mycobacteriales bacterium]
MDVATGSGDTQDLAPDLAEIARVLLARSTVAETLQQVIALSVKTTDGCDEAGIYPAAGSGAAHSASTSQLVTDLDALQTTLGEGPCGDAIGGVNCVYSHDLADEPRWPRFAPAAADLGLRSVAAYRLFDGEQTLGALQLYGRHPASFNHLDRAQGLLFAAIAGLALGNAEGEEAARIKFDELQKALISREVIGQAQGILMERERITAEQAFTLLRVASQRLNVKLRDVAQELVDTGLVRNDQPIR